jgi:diacylglycerol kinase family enzyme
MRALLIANPRATTHHARIRDHAVAEIALRHEVRLAITRHRGHARELAEAALRAGTELVVAMGGDGTVNELVNGLLADGPLGRGGPRLGIVPLGHANVMASAIGLPRDPIEAATLIAEHAADDDLPCIGLGRADDRWFAVNAGLGVDAATVATVDELRRRGLPASAATYAAGIVKAWMSGDRTGEVLRLHGTTRDGRTVDAGNLVWAVVQNARPWTMLGDIQVQASPTADLHKGIDVVALRSLTAPVAMRQATGMFTGRGITHGDDAVVLPDLDQVEVVGGRELQLQVDGDLVGPVTAVTFRAVPDALTIVAGPEAARGSSSPTRDPM